MQPFLVFMYQVKYEFMFIFCKFETINNKKDEKAG
jgi:hypothetical protein